MTVEINNTIIELTKIKKTTKKQKIKILREETDHILLIIKIITISKQINFIQKILNNHKNHLK